MNTDKEKCMQIAICQAPGGIGFQVEHMPQFLQEDDFDNFAPHIHYFYEILWFQHGQGQHVVDFQEYEVIPNTIFLLSPGQVHYFKAGTEYTGISIKLNAEYAFQAFHTNPCYHIDEKTAVTLAHLVQQMEEECQHTHLPGNTDVLKSLLTIFLIQLKRHGTQENLPPIDMLKPSHQLYIRFRGLVEKEYMRHHTVQDYALLLNVSVRSLNKSTNECSHTSPLAFINERIILEAKRMVRYTNLMMKEIAYELGFEDPSYFVKFFKRQTGYLPNEFREDSIRY